MNIFLKSAAVSMAGWLALATIVEAATPYLLNAPVDVSGDFYDFANTVFTADKLSEFDPATATGKVQYQRNTWSTAQAFDNMLATLKPVSGNEFPGREYAANPELPFTLEFVSPRTVRIRIASGAQFKKFDSLMLVPEARDGSWRPWQYTKVAGGHRYTSAFGSVTITEKPWHIEFRDASGKLLTHTFHDGDDNTFTPRLPFSFVRRAADYSRSMAAVFTLSPGEKIFGCGESFTGLDKRGQKIVLWTTDANGIQNQKMYKPIPFFLSSAGYGMFMHATTPITCDFGNSFAGLNSLLIGDDELDLFVFLGSPKEILGEYTALTGRPPMPPLWSFGLWMSRCTYDNEKQVREISAKLRENKIPCDVLHLDTGWFETDWRCDYQFSTNRFSDPAKMISDLKNDGFRVCLWQLPYFVPKNQLFPEIIAKGLAVRDAKGNIPEEDAVLDFSNPNTANWYQEKIASLLKLGVSVIKVDFGEAAPLNGIYASGRSGFYEHNYYPLRYNKTVSDITKQTTGDSIIWARSTWAGSQRYPLHWGGDAESTDDGMAAELRGGLSLGLSGFSFWSHDVGGFVGRETPDLYLRWLAFGMMSSHSRCHGQKPKEPWTYDAATMDKFRSIVELKYRLMPYVYAQAKDSADRGLPMLRALFLEFPDDPGSWLVDDEFLYGSSILVAPLLHEGATGRNVYLPPGMWIDYQTGKNYSAGWQKIEAGEIPEIILVRDGTVLPRIALAQSTAQMDWSKIELAIFAKDSAKAIGQICLPSDKLLRQLSLTKSSGSWTLDSDPLPGKEEWKISAP
jgi:alpha-D-xyloside xylohydrolase